MAFIEFKVDLSRTAKALERVAAALDRISPPPSEPRKRKPAVFIDVQPSAIREDEIETERRREAVTEAS